MTDPAPDTILARIDAALARIEVATGGLAAAADAHARRHARLRDRVAAAIADIDAIVADAGPAA